MSSSFTAEVCLGDSGDETTQPPGQPGRKVFFEQAERVGTAPCGRGSVSVMPSRDQRERLHRSRFSAACEKEAHRRGALRPASAANLVDSREAVFFEVRVLLEDLSFAHSSAEPPEHIPNRNAQTPDARLTSALWLNRDSCVDCVHRRTYADYTPRHRSSRPPGLRSRPPEASPAENMRCAPTRLFSSTARVGRGRPAY